MPQIGDITNGKKIGLSFSGRVIWHACVDCGKERWVVIEKGKPSHIRCEPCGHAHMRRENNPAWIGGKVYSKGYVYIYYPQDGFFSSMLPKNNCYIREHRLVMAKYLNRCLLPWEIVHHKNGIKDDNRIENLQLLPASQYHVSDTYLKLYVKKLEARIEELENILEEHYILDW